MSLKFPNSTRAQQRLVANSPCKSSSQYDPYEKHSITDSFTAYEELHLYTRVKIFEFVISMTKLGVTSQSFFNLIKQTPQAHMKCKYFTPSQQTVSKEDLCWSKTLLWCAGILGHARLMGVCLASPHFKRDCWIMLSYYVSLFQNSCKTCRNKQGKLYIYMCEMYVHIYIHIHI